MSLYLAREHIIRSFQFRLISLSVGLLDFAPAIIDLWLHSLSDYAGGDFARLTGAETLPSPLFFKNQKRQTVLSAEPFRPGRLSASPVLQTGSLVFAQPFPFVYSFQ